jgi:hypothetical protein
LQGVRENGPVGYLKHFIGPQDKDMPMVLRILSAHPDVSD